MTANSGFVYRGPREFVVTDRSQASVRLLFHSTTPVPEGTEIWGAIGNFRSFSEGQWHLDGTEMVAGDGDVEVLEEIRNRDEFDEFDPYWDWMQRSKLRPHRIRLCRCRVTETLEPADASAARYEPGVAVAIDVSGETPLTAGLETQFEVWTLSPDADDPERVRRRRRLRRCHCLGDRLLAKRDRLRRLCDALGRRRRDWPPGRGVIRPRGRRPRDRSRD